MFALSLLNINLYNKYVPNIINTRQIKKFIFLFDTNVLVEPNTNINTVCIATCYFQTINNTNIISFNVYILLSA